MRVNDLINKGSLSPKHAIEALASFSVAEEGTNVLFTGLVQLIARSPDATQINLNDTELLLNFFPHDIWKNQFGPEMMENKEKFYFPLVYKIDQSWEMMSNDSFLAIVQGLVLAGNSIMKE